MINVEMSWEGVYRIHKVKDDKKPKGIKAQVGDFFRDRKATKQLFYLSQQVSNPGYLLDYHRRNGYQEPTNPERPYDQKWKQADVRTGLRWTLSPKFLESSAVRIPVPFLRVRDITSTQVDNSVSNEENALGKSVQTRSSTTERDIGIVHLGPLVLGTVGRHTTRRVNGHSDEQGFSYQKEITAYNANIAEMIRDLEYVVEKDRESIPNRKAKAAAERKMRRSDRWYAVRHAHLREALKRKPYTYK